MEHLAALASDPAVWAALATLVVMEVVLGIDNLLFISVLTNKLPPADRARVRRLGIVLALGFRLALLGAIGWLVGLTGVVVDLGVSGAPGPGGAPSFETALSWRDLILIAGGLFLLWKATREIHHHLDGGGGPPETLGEPGAPGTAAQAATLTAGAAIAQIVALDIVFSVDSILTAVGMTDDLPVMVAAVLVAVGAMLLAADPLAEFVARHPTVVMLALAFLLMIGFVLIADGFGVHVPKGYVYAPMAFSALVEALNIAAKRRKASAAGH